jgi:hypothetical protein
MKILIISLPRTGSSFFCDYLANKNNLECIHKPFNEVNNLEKYKNYNWDLNKNICVKTHIKGIRYTGLFYVRERDLGKTKII